MSPAPAAAAARAGSSSAGGAPGQRSESPQGDRQDLWERVSPALLHAGSLVAVVMLVFGQTVTFGTINWDDPYYGPLGEQVAPGLDPANLWRAWGPSSGDTPTWHPLTWWSLSLDRSLWGAWAGGFHLTAVLLHLVNTLLVWRIALAWKFSPAGALTAGLIYAVHPLQVEAATWISERKGLLAATFALASLRSWTRFASQGRAQDYWLSLGWYLVSLLCKQMALPLPAILLLLELWPLQRPVPERWRDRCFRWFRWLTPFAVVTAGFLVVAFLGQAQSVALNTNEGRTISQRLPIIAISTAAQLRRAVWPADVCVFHPLSDKTSSLDQVWPSLGILTAALVLGGVLWRSVPAALIAVVGISLALIPVSGLVLLSDRIEADRYMYWPMSLAALAAGSAVSRFAVGRTRGPTLVTACVVVGLMALSSAALVRTWSSSERVWQRAANVYPLEAIVQLRYADALNAAGQPERAFEVLEQALRHHPDHSQLVLSLAAIATSLGRSDVALDAWRKVCQQQPSAGHYFFYAQAAYDEGRMEEALAAYRHVAELDPRHAQAWNNAGIVLMTLRRPDEAIRAFEQAVAADPQFVEAAQNLARARAEQRAPRDP